MTPVAGRIAASLFLLFLIPVLFLLLVLLLVLLLWRWLGYTAYLPRSCCRQPPKNTNTKRRKD